MTDRYRRFIASPYYHSAKSKNHADLIAGWGIWDDLDEDWWIEDGFADEKSASDAAEKVNLVMWQIQDAVAADWKSTPHGLAVGDIKCEICDESEDHD